MSWITHVRIELFPLKQGDCGMSESLGEFFYTMPFFNSVAYSISAALGFLSKRPKTNNEEPPAEYTTLGLN
jgi:hypothetical protein